MYVNDVFPVETGNMLSSAWYFPIINSCTIANLSACYKTCEAVCACAVLSLWTGSLTEAADNQALDVPGSTTASFCLDFNEVYF